MLKGVVFTNGCFDLLHPGHVFALRAMAQHGRLIVAVNSDDSCRRLKGPTRPLIPLQLRLLMLHSLSCVTDAFVMRGDDPLIDLASLKPEYLAKGGTTEHVVGRELVESYGGSVITVSSLAGYSTTEIVNRCRNA